MDLTPSKAANLRAMRYVLNDSHARDHNHHINQLRWDVIYWAFWVLRTLHVVCLIKLVIANRNNIPTWDIFKSLIPTFGKQSWIMLGAKVEIKLLKISHVKILFLVSLLSVVLEINPYSVFKFLIFKYSNIVYVLWCLFIVFIEG